MRDDGTKVASVSAAAADDERTYAIDVGDTEDQVLLLVCAVVVEMVSQLD